MSGTIGAEHIDLRAGPLRRVIHAHDAITTALTDVIAILKDDSAWNRAVAIVLTGSLISRYSSLGRGDLARWLAA